jgi:hypothetical protein
MIQDSGNGEVSAIAMVVVWCSNGQVENKLKSSGEWCRMSLEASRQKAQGADKSDPKWERRRSASTMMPRLPEHAALSAWGDALE